MSVHRPPEPPGRSCRAGAPPPRRQPSRTPAGGTGRLRACDDSRLIATHARVSQHASPRMSPTCTRCASTAASSWKPCTCAQEPGECRERCALQGLAGGQKPFDNQLKEGCRAKQQQTAAQHNTWTLHALVHQQLPLHPPLLTCRVLARARALRVCPAASAADSTREAVGASGVSPLASITSCSATTCGEWAAGKRRGRSQSSWRVLDGRGSVTWPCAGAMRSRAQQPL